MRSGATNIRPFEPNLDVDGLRECVVELQEFERIIDPRMPSGESIVDEYLSQMQMKCESFLGEIFIADIEKKVVGYVQVLSKISSGELDDGDIEYGLISDLFVRQEYRGWGIGKRLLKVAEEFATENDVRWLRISVLASNQVARNAYLEMGFSELYIDLEKELN